MFVYSSAIDSLLVWRRTIYSDAVGCRSTLFGPTCDGLDTIVREHPLPFLRNGDWIVFPNMGAYSIAGAVNFNGFHVADAPFFYICSEA